MNRHFSNLRTAAMCLTLAFAAFSCSDDDNFPDAPPSNDVNGGNNLIDITLDNSISDVVGTSLTNGTLEGFDSLVLALKLSGMDRNPLDLAGDYTLFAPTNQAFANYLTSKNLVRVSQISASDLSAILSYHLVRGNVNLNGAPFQIIRSFGNQNFTLRTSPQPMINSIGSDSIVVASAGLQTADNGRIYPVNKLLIPNLTGTVPTQTISQRVIAKNLLSFDTALRYTLIRNNIAGDFTLSDSLDDFRSPQYTLFAPTEAATRQFLTDQGYSTLNTYPRNVLTDYMYHYLAKGQINTGILYDGQVIPTVQGELLVTRTGADFFVQQQPNPANYPPAKLQTTNSNLVATNGIIHIIEGPLSDN